MPETAQVWNPVDEARKRYPALQGWDTSRIVSNLSDPTRFRSAFPEYAQLDDATIQRNIAKFGAPDVLANDALRSSGIQVGAMPLGVPPPPEVDPRGFWERASSASREGATEEARKAFGPEAAGRGVLSRAGHAITGLGKEAAGVGAQLTGGAIDALEDPTQRAIIASGLIDPAIPGAYYGTQAVAALTGINQPSSVKKAIDEPSPENVQASLLQGLQVAMSGAGAGSKGSGSLIEAAKNVPEATRRSAQNTFNIGPRLTAKATAEAGKLNTEAQATFQERLTNVQRAQGNLRRGDIQAYQSKVAEIQRQNAAEAAEHAQTSKVLSDLNEARKAQVAERTQLVNDITINGEALATNLKELEKRVRGEGGAKFEAVNKAVGTTPADAAPINAAVRHAEKNILKGSPENIKIFKSILDDTRPPEASAIQTNMGMLTPDHPLYQQLMERGVIEAPTMEPIRFSDLQGYYTELGTRIRTHDLPGDVYHALKYVRDQGIGAQMQAMADTAGVGKDLTAARAFWREYSDVFHDMRAISQGGSPVARSFRAIDPDYAVSPFVGKAGLRALQQLEKYDPSLAQVAKETIAKYNQVKVLPKTVTEKVLPTAPIPKELPSVAKIRTLKVPEPPPMKTVDPQALKVQSINKIAEWLRGEGGWNAKSDVGAAGGALTTVLLGHPEAAAGLLIYPITRRAVGSTLQRPSVLKWLSKPTEGELGIHSMPKATATGGITSLKRSTVISSLSQNEFKTPEEVMLAAKEGRITPAEANRLVQKMKGSKGSSIKRFPQVEPPPQ